MKERPILFSGPLVRAILDGRKTQTRRIIKQSLHAGVHADHIEPARDSGWVAVWGSKRIATGYKNGFPCPYGQPGDRLWVRETWARHDLGPDEYPEIVYRSDRQARNFDESIGKMSPPYYLASGWEPPDRWRPSIHMPKWAARIWLEVAAVRVERLRDITEPDARAEGIPANTDGPCPCCGVDVEWCPVGWFRTLWDQINGPRNDGAYSWERNPWVWVVEFRKLEAG